MKYSDKPHDYKNIRINSSKMYFLVEGVTVAQKDNSRKVTSNIDGQALGATIKN